MVNDLNTEIFELLSSVNNDKNFQPRKIFSEVVDFVTYKMGEEGRSIELNSYETTLSPKKIPDWIEPLHFERNLNEALDALEAAESLLREDQSRKLIAIQQNYIKGMLKTSETEAELQQHNILSEGINLEKYRSSISLRFSKKVIDLLEYTKAAKVGANILYGIPASDLEYQGQEKGINRIRESLRMLLEMSRKLDKYSQEIVIPISLKAAKNNAGNYLVEKWGIDPEKRATDIPLKYNLLEFDLNEYKQISELKFQRIRGIGVQIIDKFSNTFYQPADGIVRNESSRYWNVEILDNDRGVPLGPSAFAEKHVIGPIKFANIAASINLTDISWSRYPSLINFNANRKWTIKIHDKSHVLTSSEEILDIVIHFHIAFLGDL